MGVFPKMVKCVNRTPETISVMFDGQRASFPPGPFQLPEIALMCALNQNPIFGSADPDNPHWDGASYLIGVEGHRTLPCTPLTAAQWAAHLGQPSRFDEDKVFAQKYSGDPKARRVVWNQGKKSTAASRYEAGGSPQGLATFEASAEGKA